jgi:hypothetical protein
MASNWRCVAFALENEVPRDIFVLTNYDRIELKLHERAAGLVVPLPGGSPRQSVVGSNSEDIESDSSTFDLDSLVDIDDFPISRVVDLSASLRIPDDSVEVGDDVAQPPADASGEKTSQAPKKKKKKKSKKRKRSSSERSVTSKFVRVLDGDVFVFHSITAISENPEDQLYPRVKEAEVQKVDFTLL